MPPNAPSPVSVCVWGQVNTGFNEGAEFPKSSCWRHCCQSPADFKKQNKKQQQQHYTCSCLPVYVCVCVLVQVTPQSLSHSLSVPEGCRHCRVVLSRFSTWLTEQFGGNGNTCYKCNRDLFLCSLRCSVLHCLTFLCDFQWQSCLFELFMCVFSCLCDGNSFKLTLDDQVSCTF